MQISSVNIQELIDSQEMIICFPDYRIGERIEASKYDLTVGKLFQSKQAQSISIIGIENRSIQEMSEILPSDFSDSVYGTRMNVETGWTLRPGIYFLQSGETVTMPPWLSAIVVSRTSVFRAGCLLSGSIVDPGFSGNVLVRLQVPEDYVLVLEKGAKAMSLIFNTVGTLDSVNPGELDEFKFINSLIANESYKGIWSGDKVTTNGTERGS